MRAAVISALSSGQGKTLFTTAMLQWFKVNHESVRAFKIGPDFIDPKFHEKITGISSVNLDLYMSNNVEIKDTFNYYANGFSNIIIEGVMGFYDGMDYGSSTYEVARTLKVPTILVISGKSSYNTIIAILKGMLDYKSDNTIKGVVLNRISTETHYELIKNAIKKELPQIKILGWIKEGIIDISSRHLGLDLNELNNSKLNELSESVMQNINILELLKFMDFQSESLEKKRIFYSKNRKIRSSF